MNDYETGMAGMRDALKTHDALLNAFSRKLYAEQFKDYYMSLIPAMDAIENGAQERERASEHQSQSCHGRICISGASEIPGLVFKTACRSCFKSLEAGVPEVKPDTGRI